MTAGEILAGKLIGREIGSTVSADVSGVEDLVEATTAAFVAFGYSLFGGSVEDDDEIGQDEGQDVQECAITPQKCAA
jgi:hypothetical protein